MFTHYNDYMICIKKNSKCGQVEHFCFEKKNVHFCTLIWFKWMAIISIEKLKFSQLIWLHYSYMRSNSSCGIFIWIESLPERLRVINYKVIRSSLLNCWIIIFVFLWWFIKLDDLKWWTINCNSDDNIYNFNNQIKESPFPLIFQNFPLFWWMDVILQ